MRETGSGIVLNGRSWACCYSGKRAAPSRSFLSKSSCFLGDLKMEKGYKKGEVLIMADNPSTVIEMKGTVTAMKDATIKNEDVAEH